MLCLFFFFFHPTGVKEKIKKRSLLSFTDNETENQEFPINMMIRN